MKSRTKNGVEVGVMWTGAQSTIDPNRLFSRPSNIEKLRNEASTDQSLIYGWEEHDGRSFGIQKITDKLNNIQIDSSFIKNEFSTKQKGGGYTMKIKVDPLEDEKSNNNNKQKNQPISFFVYVKCEKNTRLKLINAKKAKGLNNDLFIEGENSELGKFSIVIPKGENYQHPLVTKETKSFFGSTLKSPDYIHYLLLSRKDTEELSETSFDSYDGWKVKDFVQESLQNKINNLKKTYMRKYSRTLKKEIQMRQEGEFVRSTLPKKTVYPTIENVIEKGDHNVMIFQFIVMPSFTFDINFISQEGFPEIAKLKLRQKKKLLSDISQNYLSKYEDNLRLKSFLFEKKFLQKFHFNEKNLSKKKLNFGKYVLSNLLGAIGYWDGNIIIQATAKNDMEPQYTLIDHSLFSSVPSRSNFPRGFFWDEGFHNLLISEFDEEISQEITTSWYNLLDSDGWIPREMIIGDESRSRVPKEFLVQYPWMANPPTFTILIEQMLNKIQLNENTFSDDLEYSSLSSIEESTGSQNNKKNKNKSRISFLEKIYPKLKKHYGWYLKTQLGSEKYTFRWKGRTVDHNLPSGLDDAPRSPQPSVNEKNVDLFSWMSYYSRLLLKMEKLTTKNPKTIKNFESDNKIFQKKMVDFHYDQESGLFADNAGYLIEDPEDPTVDPTYFVKNQGYLNLFPFLLGLIPLNDTDKIHATLDLISDPERLWTDFGIASLSKSDPLFRTNENYWRGEIWININYLILRAIKKYYYQIPQTHPIYTKLRTNLITYISRDFHKTGFLWEHYSPLNGKGSGVHPFNGWTSLILLIISEIY
ncbi:mannosyl-oligosaccharide glucosidase [Anaeramoeba flamelloides]|uniref:Mannosyl-oligosaccharide glucosidase n=1 Tax=Anaeramoeba flamelloides TaxID=1746091 RepID=A0AAV7ZXA6_9EUKA|nr:mannosyl-oligosaccharide glucosidase [Anaeramoeba flamelloides]